MKVLYLLVVEPISTEVANALTRRPLRTPTEDMKKCTVSSTSASAHFASVRYSW